MRTRLAILAALLLNAVAAFAGSSSNRFPYVFALGEHNNTISRGNLDEVVRVAERYSGTFVWFRRDGHEYLLRDAGALAEARDAFAELRALEPKEHEIETRMRPYEKKIEALDERMDQLSDKFDDEELAESTRRSFEDQMRDLEREMRGLEEQMKVVEREQEQLEQEMERREKIAEGKFEEILMRAVDQGRAQRLDH